MSQAAISVIVLLDTGTYQFNRTTHFYLWFLRISANGRTCEDIDECTEESPCRGNQQHCHNTRGGYKCANVGCPQGYKKESAHSNRCKRTSRRCRSTDFVCLRKPVSISFNFMSLISNLQVGGNGIDLFTMQSARVVHKY